MSRRLRTSVRVAFGSLRQAGVPFAVLAFALVLSVLSYSYVSRDVRAGEQVRFEETLNATQDAIERRIASYFDAMSGARGLFLASDVVESGEWTRYVESLEAENRYPGLEALGYAERVSPREGSSGRVRFPITYIAPDNEAARTLSGRDFYLEPDHRAAMNLARDTGEAGVTSMDFVYADEAFVGDFSLPPGFYLYLPLYSGGEEPETVAARREDLEGFIVGAVVIKEMLRGVSDRQTPVLDFEVYDGRRLDDDRLLYDDDGIKRGGDGESEELFTRTQEIQLGGRRWSLYFATLPEFEENANRRLASFVLASGVAASLLLFGITWLLVSSRNRAERASVDLESANRELEATNRELESFSYSVSHDLRAPLRSIDGFSQILLEDYADALDEEGSDYLGRVRAASQRMGQLIDDLLALSRVTRSSLRRETVDLSALAKEIAAELRARDPERRAHFVIAGGLAANGDARLLRVALENLLGNAWKFTSREEARIEFGTVRRGKVLTYFVGDNGAGFDMAYASKLFGAFQRLHSGEEFEGTGIGLATVQRVIRRHGGALWAEGEVGQGATFYFTLGGGPRREPESRSRRDPPRSRDRTAPGAGP